MSHLSLSRQTFGRHTALVLTTEGRQSFRLIRLVRLAPLLVLCSVLYCGVSPSLHAQLLAQTAAEPTPQTSTPFSIAPFSIDVTIPLGHRCMGVLPTKSSSIADPLQAHGFVLWGADQPIVLCAVDWCEIRNGAYDLLRSELARAANTTADHVLLSSLHQHDAPVVDSDAAKLLRDVGLADELHHEEFFNECVQRLAQAVRDATLAPTPVTHLGLGQATVSQIASNRRIVEPDGSVSFRRGSRSASDSELAAADDGLIDPQLKTISFWNEQTPLVALHTYTTHPMSRYGAGEVSADFVGLARERRRRDDFRIQQIYASGCSGDITAGKYNDGSDEARAGLIDRLYQAMTTAWETTERFPLTKISHHVAPLQLPWHPKPELTEEHLLAKLQDSQQTIEQRILAAMGLASFRRVAAGTPIDLIGIDFEVSGSVSTSNGPSDVDETSTRIAASLLLFPGESFVGHQLAAQQMAGDRFVASIGYGECWPGYIPTDSAFADHFEDFWNWAGPGSEAELRKATAAVLNVPLPNVPLPAADATEGDPPQAATPIAATTLVATRSQAEQPASTPIDFVREIRPLLSQSCWRCHGPDENHREASLRLDTFEGAITGGDSGAAIVPADPDASLVLQRIMAHDDSRMPPADAAPAWTDEQIAKLRQWIAEGAHYATHWSLRPIESPVPLDLPLEAWSQNNIDRWILAPLHNAGLSPSDSADRPTLVRRLSLDLLGLPADEETIARFENDLAPDAWQRLIDRTLASPHYGERWGRHWLDQARYADTNGYSVDGERTIWPYRDWVVDAINQDLPFDQFTIEQLAGDLLPGPSREQRIATGFHRNTLINQEGGTDPEQFRVESVIDRVNTTGAVWMGLTVGCAQCHSHKYDPLSHHEYYQLYAFFNSTGDVNSEGPTVSVPTAEQDRQLQVTEERLAAARKLLENYDREFPSAANPMVVADETAWQVLPIQSATSSSGVTLTEQDEQTWLASGDVAPSDQYRLVASLPAGVERITAIRLETLTDPSLPHQGPGRAGNGNFVLSEIRLLDANDQPRVLVSAQADHSQPNYPVSHAIDNDLATGWAINIAGGDTSHGPLNSNRNARFALVEPWPVKSDDSVVIELNFGPQPAGYPIGKFRLSVTPLDPTSVGLSVPAREALVRDVEQLNQQRENLVRQIPRTLAMAELPQPRPSHVMIRGDFLRLGDPVEPTTPAWLPELEVREGQGRADRLDLARWLVSDEHPLTSRVTVNRIWMRLFGVGLVETENDFGAQGSLPTHPQLLDHLAFEFRDQEWSTKQLLRMILSSAAYRQTSTRRPEVAQVDPTGRLLGTQRRVRVEAEIVRDLMLSVSQLLDHRLGGPGVYPPQPAGIYAFSQRVPAWNESRGSDRYRRTMYTFFMRGVPFPLFTTFDAPKFETTCTRRVRSNTPLQALTLANDAALLELAGAAGRYWSMQSGDDSQRVESCFRQALGRSPSPTEKMRFLEFVQAEREYWLSHDEERSEWLESLGLSSDAPVTTSVDSFAVSDSRDQAEVATWSAVARVLFNLDEFITRE